MSRMSRNDARRADVGLRPFDLMLFRLKEELNVREDQMVADALGLTKGAFSVRKARGSFPVDLVAQLARERPSISVEYVLTGVRAASGARQGGDAGASGEPLMSVLDQAQQLLTLAHLLPPDYRDAWLAMGRALAERRKRAADAGDQK